MMTLELMILSIDYYCLEDDLLFDYLLLIDTGSQSDGMDVLAVRETIRLASDWIINGTGRILMEADTYRYFGHSMSDLGTSYRTRDKVDQVRK
ncbi:hypothetical protein EG68_05933 [Paragonimus skrjabini miyazakii]|uniref:Dehydrogenase E1 component domain-containing protein n=1 Tax=Paragonimus skrjabini miyazakii TaxID=59628 RepID=A0A8S9YV15_9TREM|nr:hypothetical protein EG68_05933 [Paragonimus skrjabini miyazakii]